MSNRHYWRLHKVEDDGLVYKCKKCGQVEKVYGFKPQGVHRALSSIRGSRGFCEGEKPTSEDK